MYLIFSKKQRITFFWPTGRAGWAKIFHLGRYYYFCKSPGPFSRAWVTKLVFAASVFSGGLFLIYVVFISKSRRYQFVFSPANKMYFICSKENHFICNRKHFIPSGEPQSIILCSDWWKQFQTMLRISVIGCCREEYSEPDARSADGQPPVLRRHNWTTADHQPEGRRDTIEEV